MYQMCHCHNFTFSNESQTTSHHLRGAKKMINSRWILISGTHFRDNKQQNSRVDDVRVVFLVRPGAEKVGRPLFAVGHPHRARPAEQLSSVLGLRKRFVHIATSEMSKMGVYLLTQCGVENTQ